MPENVIERLRLKEEEMEALVSGARNRAAFIRQDAVRRAGEIKGSGLAALDAEISRLGAEFEDGIRQEVSRIEKGAGLEAEGLREKGRRTMEEAVRQAVKFIAGNPVADGSGGDDKKDGEGPHNRPQDASR